MSEPIVYRIATEFSTDRPLKIEELVSMARASLAQVVDSDEDSMDPFRVVDPVLRVWAGDSEVAGLDPKPVNHVYVAFYEVFLEGNNGDTKAEADEYGRMTFLEDRLAQEKADWYLENVEMILGVRRVAGSRVKVGVRMVVVPEDIYSLLSAHRWNEWAPEEQDRYSEWLANDLWNAQTRVAEHLRYRNLT